MGRIYTVQFNGVAATVQQDLFELTAGSSVGFKVHELGLSQTTNTGDANEKEWLILMKSGQTTSGSGGTAPTPVPNDFGDSAAAAAAEVNNTTKASAGTIVTHYPWSWNIRVPFQYIWTPESRPMMRVSRRMTIELGTTPAASTTINGYLVIEELG